MARRLGQYTWRRAHPFAKTAYLLAAMAGIGWCAATRASDPGPVASPILAFFLFGAPPAGLVLAAMAILVGDRNHGVVACAVNGIATCWSALAVLVMWVTIQIS